MICRRLCLRKKSLCDDMDILWLNTCEDLIAFMEVSTGGTVIGKDRSEFESASGDEGKFVHGTFEGFHRDSTGEAVRATGIGAVEADFFGTQREKKPSAWLGVGLVDF